MTITVMPIATPAGGPAQSGVAAPASDAVSELLGAALPFTELLRELVAEFVPESVPDTSAGGAAPASPVTDGGGAETTTPALSELVALAPSLAMAAPAPVAVDALPVTVAPDRSARVGANAFAVAQPVPLAQSVPLAQHAPTMPSASGAAPQDAAALQAVATVPLAPAAPLAAGALNEIRPSSAASQSQAVLVQPALATNAAPVAAADSAPTEAVLKLPNGAPAQWRQPLLQALGERLHVDVERGFERAVIRLDPPAMGSVEIVIRHQGGALQVQLTATHGEVLRQLHGIGESLRDGLVQRNFGEVSVQVSDATQDGAGRQRRGQAQEEDGAPGRALGDETRTAFALDAERG